MTRPCQEWATDLVAYCDNSLPPEQAHDLERHLEGCATCQRDLESWRRVAPLIRHAYAPLSPASAPDLWPAVRDRIRQEETTSRQVHRRLLWKPFPWRFTWQRISLAGVTALAILLAWTYLANFGGVVTETARWEITAKGPPTIESVEVAPGFGTMVIRSPDNLLPIVWVIPGDAR